MPLPPEVVRTIQALDKKIKAIEETKRRLIESFGGVVDSPVAVIPKVKEKPQQQPQTAVVEPTPAATAAGNSTERFIAYLREHSPATRAELVIGAQIPNGSISWLLKKLPMVQRRNDGKFELMREN